MCVCVCVRVGVCVWALRVSQNQFRDGDGPSVNLVNGMEFIVIVYTYMLIIKFTTPCIKVSLITMPQFTSPFTHPHFSTILS